MDIHKFFYFTIQGDDLDLAEAQRVIHLPCEIYRKGEILASEIKGKALWCHTPQKTNRWLYSAEDFSEISSEQFLLDQLDILIEHIAEFQSYIAHRMAYIDVNLYADDETHLEFTIEHINRLKQLGLGVSITFC